MLSNKEIFTLDSLITLFLKCFILKILVEISCTTLRSNTFVFQNLKILGCTLFLGSGKLSF